MRIACYSVLTKTILLASSATVAADLYRGDLSTTQKATGFFRVEKNDRWWLVTPEGNAFLSWGINHLYLDLWMQDSNCEAWKRMPGLESLKGPASNSALRSWFMGIRERPGFNTVGVHNSLNSFNDPQPEMAHMQPISFVDIKHTQNEVSYAPILVLRKAGRQHSGLLDGYGEPYPHLEKVLKKGADHLYSIANR